MNYLETIDQVKAHAAALFHTKKDNRLIYHNLQHTEMVVKAVVKIANHYKLSDQDFFVVTAAAWFHDTGYLTSFEEHEARGAESAREFLNGKGMDPAVIELVVNCILATKMPQHPVSLLEQIVCDADLFHLGGDNFKERNKLMRREVEAYFGKDIDKNEWRIKTIALFENHHYHTEYCQDLLTAKKMLNLQEMKDKAQKEADKDSEHHKGGKEKKGEAQFKADIQKKEQDRAEAERKQERKAGKKLEKHYENAAYTPADQESGASRPESIASAPIAELQPEFSLDRQAKKDNPVQQQSEAGITIEKRTKENKEMSKKDKDKKNKSERPEKGIETMFRITSGNQQRLSDMADNKAHIMISTNSIILSVILSILLRKLEDNPHLIIPTLILLVICVVTMVFSILATRPTLPAGTFTKDDVAEKKVNLLFFGNFYKMELPDYFAGMEQMMEDRDYLYGSLIKDLYSQGVVLGRKYHLLRIAYNVFMFGIIASVLAFMIAAGWAAL
jgi:predicted metal-dependent HD superfamily phosphohydrolase